MSTVLQALPDPEVMIALEPEELGAKLLFVARRLSGGKMFQLAQYGSELINHLQMTGSEHRDKIPQIEMAFVEASSWLEVQGLIVPEPGINGTNGWRRLSRRAKHFEDEAELKNFAVARMLPRDLLHASIRDQVWMAFIRGNFDVAVFQAMKQVEILVRDASGASAKMVGVKLARHAFHPDSGPLTDQTVEPGERQARADLFAGALGSYKNPQSHRHVALDDPIEAIEQIMIASHLLRIVDDCRP